MRSSLPRDRNARGIASPSGTLALARSVAALALFAATSSSALGHAQERWLFVPVLSGGNAKTFDAGPVTSELETELRGAGQTVLLNASAARLFETQQSAEPVQLSADEVKRLSKSVAQASRHLALGELNDAQRAMESVNGLNGPTRDFLNRELPRARKIYDNCLMAAYLWERADQHRPALKQMDDCARNFPGLRPEGRAYPGEVRRLLEEASLQMNQAPTSLRVTSVGRNGCTVRLNGIDAGRSPVQVSELRAGPTRVQLECEAGVIGRIHTIELKPGENELAIDAGFDAAVHTQGGLWLTYPNERERDKRAATDGQSIAKALDSTRSVMLFSTAGALGQDVVVRPGGPGANKEVARAGFAADSGYAKGAPSKVASALVAWLRAQPKAAGATASNPSPRKSTEPPPRIEQPAPAPSTAPPPPQAPPWAAAAPVQPQRRGKYTQQHAAAGAILAVIGGAASAVSWVVYADRQNKRRVVSDTMNETKYQRAGVITLASAALGTTLLSVSEYFWLPDEPQVPAAAWVVGGIGVSLGATAIALSFTTSNCQLGDTRVSCQHFWSDHFFGPMLFMHALPLITVPAWYGLRMAFRPAGVQISMSTSVQGLPGLNLQGVF